MKSGLEGRNNTRKIQGKHQSHWCLNEVRPRRPEQSDQDIILDIPVNVSMKSGLEGRNNKQLMTIAESCAKRLNEVRPRRPEQFVGCCAKGVVYGKRLNEVRPRRPEQSLVPYRYKVKQGKSQ